jgi:hypothetical protein
VLRCCLLVLVAGCGTRPPVEPDDAGQPELDAGSTDDAGQVIDAGAPDAGTTGGFDGGYDAGADLDRDGLPDAFEERIAVDYLPSLSLHPSDGCPLGGLAYRVRPHPRDPALLHIVFTYLFERDCGIGSHVGDNEAFGITVNPAKSAPEGITAMKAISHQKTLCEKVTECGSCNGLKACDAGDAGRPRLYSSRGKHGGYVDKSVCTLVAICPDDCAAGERLGVPLVNVGEPSAHLVNDLTDAGFITAANGWTRSELFHFDPWGPVDFGGAGLPADDLVDPSFDTAACR